MVTQRSIIMNDPNGGRAPTVAWRRGRPFGKHSGPRNVESQSHFSGHAHQGSGA
jgi:hypothetical protein